MSAEDKAKDWEYDGRGVWVPPLRYGGAHCAVGGGSGCVLFCYAKNGSVKCLPFGGDHNSLLNAGWKHTATIDAAIWIERLMAGHPDDAVGMMDELNFGPNHGGQP